MNVPQIDGYLPAGVLRVIGAGKTLAGRSTFYANFPQFLMIAVLFYKSSPTLQALIPSIYHWIGVVAICGVGAVLFEYSVVMPSQIMFNAGQNSRENRNPLYKQIMELHRRLDDFEQSAQTDGGQVQPLIPVCSRCEADAIPGEHKDEPAWVCPECESILYREVDG